MHEIYGLLIQLYLYESLVIFLLFSFVEIHVGRATVSTKSKVISYLMDLKQKCFMYSYSDDNNDDN